LVIANPSKVLSSLAFPGHEYRWQASSLELDLLNHIRALKYLWKCTTNAIHQPAAMPADPDNAPTETFRCNNTSARAMTLTVI
jgi:hypothetical protein